MISFSLETTRTDMKLLRKVERICAWRNMHTIPRTLQQTTYLLMMACRHIHLSHWTLPIFAHGPFRVLEHLRRTTNKNRNEDTYSLWLREAAERSRSLSCWRPLGLNYVELAHTTEMIYLRYDLSFILHILSITVNPGTSASDVSSVQRWPTGRW